MEMITLKNKKPTFGQSVKMGIGVFLLIIGVLSMLSIVGFLPGIGFFLVGYLLMHFGRPKVAINCANCGGEIEARQGEKKAKCEHCETANPIKWTKA